ncbi:ATP-binding cassette domain-containing protein [Cohnella silvisoli]|uniref:ATP-binding cassette domain-containing protein n=1 Tax=Cohnella silvisoli TaxID=2873699 RepID=A0ABV1KXK2_9BACL|nr:ATP-binding cassette domain-containing protein [Cohnella silvisoli]MCD9024090.1 ATP-binding cassette domain-containing protein [Cohnella silvisoli]
MEIEKINVDIIEGLYFPKMENYGQMIDYIKEFHYIFEKGKSYGIIGECGEGGWGLSYNLVGREHCKDGDILINQKTATMEDLKSISWYVGESTHNRWLFSNKSILSQLKNGVSNNQFKNRKSVEEIVDMFGLSKDRLKMKFEELGWEKWRTSIAIGFANGKQVFCFPWVSTGWINDLIMNSAIHICIDVLKKNGSIIILPTQRAESVDFFLDDIVYLQNQRHTISKRAREVVENYKQSKLLKTNE